MGKLLAFIRSMFQSLFGHRDLIRLLGDDFEVDEDMDPETSPAALLRKARRARRPPPPRRRRRQPPPPAQLQRDTVAQGMARDTFGSMTDLEVPEVSAFDWSAEFGPGETSEDVIETREAPPRAPQPAPPVPVVRLTQRAGSLRSSTGAPRSSGGMMPSGAMPAAMQGSAALAHSLVLEPPSPDHGPPPSTLWDEGEIKMELLEQLDEERSRPPEGVRRRDWRVALDRLGTSMGELQHKLPPLPTAAGTLLGARGARPSDEDVIEAIQGDPALAARLVKAANSPFYMAATPASSLQSALVRLGLEEARRIALAAAFEDTFELSSDPELLDDLRRHALATAIAGEIFARSAQDVDAGEAFLAGLLHDAGTLLVHRMVREVDGKAVDIDVEAARELAARTHQRVGALLFGEWDLEAGVAACIGWHHAPGQAEERFWPLCYVVSAADQVAEVALAHVESKAWQTARALYAERDDEGARQRAVEADGLAELELDPLLSLVPPGFGRERLEGVIRGVLLRMETTPV